MLATTRLATALPRSPRDPRWIALVAVGLSIAPVRGAMISAMAATPQTRIAGTEGAAEHAALRDAARRRRLAG